MVKKIGKSWVFDHLQHKSYITTYLAPGKRCFFKIESVIYRTHSQLVVRSVCGLSGPYSQIGNYFEVPNIQEDQAVTIPSTPAIKGAKQGQV